jgi:hypothetical protein
MPLMFSLGARLVTTFEDIPGTADVKQVARVLDALRSRLAA